MVEKGKKTPLLKRERLKKNKKAWNLIVEGTLLGKIGTFMNEKGTKVLLRNDWKGTKRP